MIDSDPDPNLSFGSPEYRRIVTKSGGLLYTTYVNRNLAWICSRVLRRFSPNQISIGAFCILFVALPMAYSSQSIATSLTAYGLLVLNYVLDSSDGQVARLRKLGSPLGEWVDHSLDGVRILLIHSTLLLVVAFADVSQTIRFAAYLNIIFASSMFFATELAAKILPTNIQRADNHALTWKKLARSLVLLPADHGIFIIIFLLVHKPDILAVIYAVYGVYWASIFVVYYLMTFVANSRMQK